MREVVNNVRVPLKVTLGGYLLVLDTEILALDEIVPTWSVNP